MKPAIIVLLPLLIFVSGCAHPGIGSHAGHIPLEADARAASTPAGLASAGAAATDALPPAGSGKDADWDAATEAPGHIADPLEPFNRAMFQFNDRFYFWILKPTAKGYRAVVPRFARTGLANFFNNLAAPIRLVNSLLQGKGEQAGFEFARFFVNTTVGVLGFGNPAGKDPALNPPEEDFGQTMGVWGLGNGFYLVLPLLGPSTFRDSIGRLGDFFLYPVSYVRPLGAWVAVRGTQAVNETSLRIGDYEALKEAAISPYTAFRDAYVQHRKAEVEK